MKMTEACSQCGIQINLRVEGYITGIRDEERYWIHPSCREEWLVKK